MAAKGSCAGILQGIFTTASSSKETVPKAERESVAVSVLGLEGDRQECAVDEDWGGHGGPLKAVCCWSADVMVELQREGHPVLPGFCGENFLLGGLDWEQVVPGLRLEVGAVLLEVTQHVRPCHKQASNFLHGQYSEISPVKRPRRSRVYCAVLVPGKVSLGDAVKLHVNTRGAKAYAVDPCVLGRSPRLDWWRLVLPSRPFLGLSGLALGHFLVLGLGLLLGRLSVGWPRQWR
uniref:MOSC domain-containing protein n=1 Tax=Pyrodinium bahamense TaxID=73915 RepID=A0A7S0FAV3_9DINO